MDDFLVKRSPFARMVGISPSRVTVLCQETLKDAMVGKYIDLAHSAVQKYLEKRGVELTPEMRAAAEAGRARQAPQELPDIPVESPSVSEDKTQADYGDPEADPYLEYARPIFEEYGADRCLAAMSRTLHIEKPRARRIRDQLNEGWRGPDPKMIPDPREADRAPATGAAAARIQREMTRPAEIPKYPMPESFAEYGDWTLREVVQTFGTSTKFKEFLDALGKMEQTEERRLKNEERSGKLIARDLVSVAFIDVFDAAHRRLMTDGARSLSASVAAKIRADIPTPEIEAHISDVIGSFITPAKDKAVRYLDALRDAG